MQGLRPGAGGRRHTETRSAKIRHDFRPGKLDQTFPGQAEAPCLDLKARTPSCQAAKVSQRKDHDAHSCLDKIFQPEAAHLPNIAMKLACLALRSKLTIYPVAIKSDSIALLKDRAAMLRARSNRDANAPKLPRAIHKMLMSRNRDIFLTSPHKHHHVLMSCGRFLEESCKGVDLLK